MQLSIIQIDRLETSHIRETFRFNPTQLICRSTSPCQKFIHLPAIPQVTPSKSNSLHCKICRRNQLLTSCSKGTAGTRCYVLRLAVALFVLAGAANAAGPVGPFDSNALVGTADSEPGRCGQQKGVVYISTYLSGEQLNSQDFDAPMGNVYYQGPKLTNAKFDPVRGEWCSGYVSFHCSGEKKSTFSILSSLATSLEISPLLFLNSFFFFFLFLLFLLTERSSWTGPDENRRLGMGHTQLK